ncbi:MAG: glycosyltransferase family 4 protein [Sphingobacterium sp.]
MKKVAFFSEILIEDQDGASRTIYQLINRIDRSAYQYLFIHGRGPELLNGHSCFQVGNLRLPMNDDYSIALPQFNLWKLQQTLDTFQPDVIHISTPSILGFFALRYAKSRDIPVISIYHTHFISYISYYLRNIPVLIKPLELWVRKAMVRFYNGCEKVYVPSNNILHQLNDYGIRPEKLKLWQRGIDLTLFNPEKADRNYLQQLTKNKKPNILFVSRLVWEKNLQTLFDIYKRIQAVHLECNLVVVGEGSAAEETKMNMPNAYFMGKLDHQELSRVYASADVFIFPSTSETYGNVVIEAMASGLPCVIANGGGSSSLVEHDVSGYKCVPNNALEYVYFIKKILDDKRIQQQFKEAGLRFVQQLDWTTLTNSYFQDINELVAQSRKPFVWAGA